jgi:prepilin peptidase CpaA
MAFSTLPPAAAFLLLVYAAWTDVVRLKIPNAVALSVLILFAGYAALTSMGWRAALSGHVAAGLLVLAAGILLHVWGKMGAGDVKLLAAVSVWFGWEMLAAGLLVTTLAGAVVCGLVLMFRRSSLPAWLEARGMRSLALAKGHGAPYAPAVAAGFLLVQLATR